MSEEEKKYPSLSQQANNLSHTIFDIFNTILNGEEVWATKDVQEERKKICISCEFYDQKQHRCIDCGCFLDAKIPLAMARCHLDKWGMDKDHYISQIEKELDKEKNKE